MKLLVDGLPSGPPQPQLGPEGPPTSVDMGLDDQEAGTHADAASIGATIASGGWPNDHPVGHGLVEAPGAQNATDAAGPATGDGSIAGFIDSLKLPLPEPLIPSTP